jgi:hypothetical protein
MIVMLLLPFKVPIELLGALLMDIVLVPIYHAYKWFIPMGEILYMWVPEAV